MPVRWAEGYDANVILQLLNQFTNLDSEGNLTFHTFGHQDLIALLNSMLEFDPDLATLDKERLLFRAIGDARRNGALTPATLLRAATRLQQHFLQLPSKKYVLLSTISFAKSSFVKPVRVNE